MPHIPFRSKEKSVTLTLYPLHVSQQGGVLSQSRESYLR